MTNAEFEAIAPTDLEIQYKTPRAVIYADAKLSRQIIRMLKEEIDVLKYEQRKDQERFWTKHLEHVKVKDELENIKSWLKILVKEKP